MWFVELRKTKQLAPVSSNSDRRFNGKMGFSGEVGFCVLEFLKEMEGFREERNVQGMFGEEEATS